MEFFNKTKFSFYSAAPGLNEDTFAVVGFKGSEALSRCFEFDIELVSGESEIDLAAVMKSSATFIIHRDEGGDIPFHGYPSFFEQMNAFGKYVFYRIKIMPKLWWLSLTHHNQVFLDMTLPDILTAVLQDGGLTTRDFEIKLHKDYPEREYVCQYKESHLNFVYRWMEREGIYFYFDHREERDVVVFTDTKIAHTEMPEGKTMIYSPPSGLDSGKQDEVIQQFICRQQMTPRRVLLKDYNYETPSMELSGRADVSKENGRGEDYVYGEHFLTPEEGNRLAAIRAEEHLCRQTVFYGESSIPLLRPGYIYELTDHYRNDFNQKYLTTTLTHEGDQSYYMVAGLQEALADREKQFYYRNSFSAIPEQVQFRPERTSDKPRFHGSLNAKIDSAGSGQYAELDDVGRYKVILPFDLSGRKDLKASAWMRMTQPYAGADHGMHFPLHKGTEVLLSFMDGDPDRPIITGAVPNAATPSMVNDTNASMAGFRTAGGNTIHMEDKEGAERIIMQTGDQDSMIKMGRSSPESEIFTSSHHLTNIVKGGGLELIGGAKNVFAGFSHVTVTGMFRWNLLMSAVSAVTGAFPGLLKSSMGLGDHEAGAQEVKENWRKCVAAIDHIETIQPNVHNQNETTPITTEDINKIKGYKDLFDGAKDDAEAAIKELEDLHAKGENLTDADRTKMYQQLQILKEAIQEEKAELEKYTEKEDEKADTYLTGSSIAGGVITAALGITASLIDEIFSYLHKFLLHRKITDYDIDDFIYTVVHKDGSMIVSQKSQFAVSKLLPWKWKALYMYFKKPKMRPKGMLFFEGRGSQVFCSEENFEVSSGEINRQNAKQTDIASEETTTLFAKHQRISSKEGLELRTGYKPSHLNKPPTDSPSIPDGIRLVAGEDHNIELMQAAMNNDGKITLNSNNEVKIYVGDNSITVKDNEVTIEATSDSQITAKKDGIKLETKPVLGDKSSTLELTASGCDLSAGKGNVKVDLSGAEVEGHGNKLTLSVTGAKIDGKTIQLG